MKQLNSDKYNVAWYKLAEFVVRKEKERALALLRLLTHSFNDQALKEQLEGDLLRSFDDHKNASDKYFNAAQRYSREGKAIDSAALYELLMSLNPKDFMYVKHSLIHYRSMCETNRIKELLLQSLSLIISQGSFNYLDDLFTFGAELSSSDYYQVLEQTVVELVEKNAPEQIVQDFIKKTIKVIHNSQGEMTAERLLAHLKQSDELWYEYAESVVCEL